MFSKILLTLCILFVTSPTTLGLLFPPEGHDYPLYDFPTVQYVPHNTLVEYQDPRQLETDNDAADDEDEDSDDDDDDKMEVSPRSTYFPLTSDSSSDSSADTLPCTTEDIARMLNPEDLDKMIKIVAKIEGMSVKEILLKLASKHGLHLKGGRRGTPIVAPPVDPLRSLQILDASPPPQRPMIHLRRPPKGLPPPPSEARPLPIEEGANRFDHVAIEVPAIPPRGLATPTRMQALVLVEDATREEVARMPVDLGPRMALLDVLKEAKLVFALDHGPYRHNPFAIKARKLESERCLGLQSIGQVVANPNSALQITITRTRPIAELVWESPCLPRVSELLIRPGDVIILAPR